VSARSSAWLLPLALLVGCGGGSTEAADGSGASDGSGSGAETAEAAGFEVQGDVLTTEEAEAQAEKEITAENAEKEYEKLKKSIGG
jgi:hypothetical protein